MHTSTDTTRTSARAVLPETSRAGRRRQPFSVYGTWGFHDELGDNVELSEALVHAALDRLACWRADHDFGYDVFHIDAFWFDPEKGYLHFKKPHWPRGFGPTRDRILAMGMVPGLWFSVNGVRLDVPAWSASRNADGSCYSLVDGPYAAAFEAALHHAVMEWAVRYIKLDFGAFGVCAADSARPTGEHFAESVRILNGILRRLREVCPDVCIIAHCGFNRGGTWVAPGQLQMPFFDLSLLEGLDYYFSSDPHPGEMAATSMARCLDLYQDRRVWCNARIGQPLDRIDDHGVLIGKTNTALYRGRAGVRRSHLAQLARGARRDFLYGDLTLLTDDDVRGMKATRGIFFDAFARGLTTSLVGGEPGVAPWHGALTGGGGRGLLYVVNSTFQTQQAVLPICGAFFGQVLFHDGAQCPAVSVLPDRVVVEMGPEQMVLIGLGEYAHTTLALGTEKDDPPPRRTRLLPLTFDPVEGGGLRAADCMPPADGDELFVFVRALDCEPDDAVTGAPLAFGRQQPDDGHPAESAAWRAVTVDVHIEGALVTPVARIPDIPVWSGVYWVAQRYADVTKPFTVTISQALNPPRRLIAEVYAFCPESRRVSQSSG